MKIVSGVVRNWKRKGDLGKGSPSEELPPAKHRFNYDS